MDTSQPQIQPFPTIDDEYCRRASELDKWKYKHHRQLQIAIPGKMCFIGGDIDSSGLAGAQLTERGDYGMAEAFGRDIKLECRVREIVARHGIKTVVETGSWRGYTARRFSEFVPSVRTIEIDAATAEIAKSTLRDATNSKVIHGGSATVLPWLIGGLDTPVLYYLDAHWREAWPILDEIRVIARQDFRCVIVVHDVQVPGTDLGFDTYGGQALTFDFLKPELDKLRFPWRHSFNDASAQGHRRGALFIEPLHF